MLANILTAIPADLRNVLFGCLVFLKLHNLWPSLKYRGEKKPCKKTPKQKIKETPKQQIIKIPKKLKAL